MKKKTLTALTLAGLFFWSSNYFLMAASFNPVYNGIFSTAAAGASPAVTFDVQQGSGQDALKDIVFNFPVGFDIKGANQLSQGVLIGSGQLSAVVFGSNQVFPLTIRSFSKNGVKAIWEFNFGSEIVDATLNGSSSSGHTLTFIGNVVPISTPLDLNFAIQSGVFTNLVNGGPFTFSANMTSMAGLTASSSWTGAITPPPPGPPPPTPTPTPSPPPPGPPPPPTSLPPQPVQSQSVPTIKKPAPVVNLETMASKTNQRQNLIKGTVNFGNPITSVEVSLDAGRNWFQSSVTNLNGNSLNFQFLTPLLDDDNYTIEARATDSAGLVGVSAPFTLVVDTAPPVVGSNELLLGGTSIFPGSDGTIAAVVGVGQKIVVSAKGGPTSVTVESGKTNFPLSRIDDGNLWQGRIKFTREGSFPLTVRGVDGAGNITERAINPISVVSAGEVVDKKSGKEVKATVTLYTQDENGEWLLWDGESYSQVNPVQTEGNYSFFVPVGKYYLKVEANDYREFVSTEFSVSRPTPLNFQIPLVKRPSLNLFGWKLVIPTWLDFTAQVVPVELTRPTHTKLSHPVLPNLVNFSGGDQNGVTHSLSDYRGKDVVFTFWSTWNLSSAEQLNQLEQVKGLQVIPIASQDTQGAVISYVNRGNFGLKTLLIDSGGTIGSIFGITTAPQHFFVNKQGKVVEVRIGILSAKEIMEIGRKLD